MGAHCGVLSAWLLVGSQWFADPPGLLADSCYFWTRVP